MTSYPTQISSFSLHDALPISRLELAQAWMAVVGGHVEAADVALDAAQRASAQAAAEPFEPSAGRAASLRSEEHTSELQSRLHLVCRLLLEKKKYFYKWYLTYQ